MIKLNNTVGDKNFEKRIEYELEQFDYLGYISIPVLKIFYNLFSWVYFDKEIIYEEKNEEALKLKKLISLFDLKYFKGSSLYYSSVLFYIYIAKFINLRFFSDGKVVKIKSKVENKAFIEEFFKFKTLYNLYKDSKEDIPKNFLLFSSIFEKNSSKQIKKINNYSQIYNVTAKSDLVRPDFKIKLATKNLNVNTIEDNNEINNKIIILQDCSLSMTKHREKLNVLKAYILNEALTKDFNVEWNFCNSDFYKTILFTPKNIEENSIENVFSGISFLIEELLEDLITKNFHSVIIITDGEDNFNIPFTLVGANINTISFNYNRGLQANILKYGKFIKF